MLDRYREFNAVLTPLGRSTRIVVLSPRQAWQLRLDDGLTLDLGRDQANSPLQDRLQRFAATYGQAKARLHASIASIDMRYPNGFALRPGHSEVTQKTDTTAASNTGKGNT